MQHVTVAGAPPRKDLGAKSYSSEAAVQQHHPHHPQQWLPGQQYGLAARAPHQGQPQYRQGQWLLPQRAQAQYGQGQAHAPHQSSHTQSQPPQLVVHSQQQQQWPQHARPSQPAASLPFLGGGGGSGNFTVHGRSKSGVLCASAALLVELSCMVAHVSLDGTPCKPSCSALTCKFISNHAQSISV